MWTTSTEYDSDGNIVNMERIEVPDPPTEAVVTVDVAEVDAAIDAVEKATTVATLRSATLRLAAAIRTEA